MVPAQRADAMCPARTDRDRESRRTNASSSVRKGSAVNHACCTSCRIRFTPAVTACPGCGEPPHRLTRARGSHGVSPGQTSRRSAFAARGSCRVTSDSGPRNRSTVSDAHLRILGRVAQQRRIALDDHDTADHTAETHAGRRRQRLQQSATRATDRVAEAEARRRHPRSDRVSSAKPRRSHALKSKWD